MNLLGVVYKAGELNRLVVDEVRVDAYILVSLTNDLRRIVYL